MNNRSRVSFRYRISFSSVRVVDYTSYMPVFDSQAKQELDRSIDCLID